MKFLKSKAKYRLLSSGYGSGKSKLGCRESIRHALEYPGTRHLVGRLTAEQLRKTTMVTYFRELQEIGLREGTHYTFNSNRGEIRWKNGTEDHDGSVTLFSHLDDPTGATYGSLEITTAFIDEGSEVSDAVYRVLFPSRMRWHMPGCEAKEKMLDLLALGKDKEALGLTCHCPLRAWICTNPGASGYLRDVVYERMGDDWDYFAVPPFENPFNGAAWKEDMQKKGEIYGQAWLDRFINGDWDAFEGQRFTMFNRDLHIIPEDQFELGERHTVIEGWDFGNHENFVVWMAYDEYSDDPVVVFDEYVAYDAEGKDIAAEVRRRRHKWGIDSGSVMVFGDPGGRSKAVMAEKSPIQFYNEQGIYIIPCDVGKEPGPRADMIASFLSVHHTTIDGNPVPGLVMTNRCPKLASSIIEYSWDMTTNTHGERKEKFIKVNDHGVDALGYGLAGVIPGGNRPKPKGPPVRTAPSVSDLRNHPVYG